MLLQDFTSPWLQLGFSIHKSSSFTLGFLGITCISISCWQALTQGAASRHGEPHRKEVEVSARWLPCVLFWNLVPSFWLFGGLRDMVLMEEVHYWSWALKFQNPCHIKFIVSASHLWFKMWALRCCFSGLLFSTSTLPSWTSIPLEP